MEASRHSRFTHSAGALVVVLNHVFFFKTHLTRILVDVELELTFDHRVHCPMSRVLTERRGASARSGDQLNGSLANSRSLYGLLTPDVGIMLVGG